MRGVVARTALARKPASRPTPAATALTAALLLCVGGLQLALSRGLPAARPIGDARPGPVLAQNDRERGPVVDHDDVAAFLSLSRDEIAAAAALRMLFVDHSVGQNISEALDCTAFASIDISPTRCRRFEHVLPELSADPRLFRFGAAYDRSRWTYLAQGSSYWREWPTELERALSTGPPWDVVIPMPSYLVAPNGGWTHIESLEAAHPAIRFVYATSSLPRGAPNDTESDLVMEAFNADARSYALQHGKPLLDVADILSHDYDGNICCDGRDGREYCQNSERCENLPDDGHDIPAICQHYTSELYGGHLGSVSGGGLRMAQAVWVLMARLATSGDRPSATPAPSLQPTAANTADHIGPTSAAPTASASAHVSPETAAPTRTASREPATARLHLPAVHR